MSSHRTISVPYCPRPVQKEIHDGMDKYRFGLVVAHRRLGKTVCSVNELIKAAWYCPLPNPRVAYIAPFFKQAKSVAWDMFRFYASRLPGKKINEAELRIDFGGDRRIQLFGTDNPDAMRGLYFDYVVLDEFATMNPRAWPEIIRPALADREGKALIKGTPQGQNAFFEMYNERLTDPKWFVRVYRASETGILSKDELEDARKAMSQEQYDQEFECSWSAGIRGAYFARLLEEAEKEGRIAQILPDPAAEVHTGWDLGVRDATAIWFFQKQRGSYAVIDYYENSGLELSHYTGVLRDKSRPKSEGGLAYQYGRHFVPHDAKVRDLKTGMDLVAWAAQLGVKLTVLERVTNVNHRIETARNFIPRCYFDKTRCKAGLDALRGYRRASNDRTGELLDYPLHSWESNGADAFCYASQGAPMIGGGNWQPLKYQDLSRFA